MYVCLFVCSGTVSTLGLACMYGTVAGGPNYEPDFHRGRISGAPWLRGGPNSECGRSLGGKPEDNSRCEMANLR